MNLAQCVVVLRTEAPFTQAVITRIMSFASRLCPMGSGRVELDCDDDGDDYVVVTTAALSLMVLWDRIRGWTTTDCITDDLLGQSFDLQEALDITFTTLSSLFA